MEISDQLLCLFTAPVEQQDGNLVVEIPIREHRFGDVEAGRTYRIAVFPHHGDTPQSGEPATSQPSDPPTPPVTAGETRVVEIEDIGEQGDGITRVDQGYVVIIPDTEQGEEVRIEITDVKETVAFATVTERLSYYD